MFWISHRYLKFRQIVSSIKKGINYIVDKTNYGTFTAFWGGKRDREIAISQLKSDLVRLRQFK